jgi:hypothetical protein
MSTIIKNIIKIIGLSKLLGYVWEIAHDELVKIAEKSASEWDDKAVAFLDEMIKQVITELPDLTKK